MYTCSIKLSSIEFIIKEYLGNNYNATHKECTTILFCILCEMEKLKLFTFYCKKDKTLIKKAYIGI